MLFRPLSEFYSGVSASLYPRSNELPINGIIRVSSNSLYVESEFSDSGYVCDFETTILL